MLEAAALCEAAAVSVLGTNMTAARPAAAGRRQVQIALQSWRCRH